MYRSYFLFVDFFLPLFSLSLSFYFSIFCDFRETAIISRKGDSRTSTDPQSNVTLPSVTTVYFADGLELESQLRSLKESLGLAKKLNRHQK